MTITGKTALLAVVGDPVAHSLSPAMHNGWIADHGLDAIYAALPVPGDARAFFQGLKQARFKGVNITVPHKEAAAALADRVSGPVANVWRKEEDGSVSAFNTDGQGFIASLDEGAPGWTGNNVLVIGAGGAAQGIVDALVKRQCLITVANRTLERAEAIAAPINGGRAAPWEALPDLFAEADLIIQTTTLGMGGRDSPAWPIERARADVVVVDIVYRPLETPLLAAARARGLKTVDGLGMLLHQGALAFELWFGVAPDTRRARARLEAILAEEGA